MKMKIVVQAEDLWKYFQANKPDFATSMHEIASNDEFGTVVFVTEEDGLPKLVVFLDGDEIYSEITVSAADCEKTAKKIYSDYLTSKVVDILMDKDAGEDEYSRLDLETMIDDRELELDDALLMFFGEIFKDDACMDYYLDDDMIEDVKEHFLEYLARKWELPIYRPMFLEDEDGEEFFEEYPYEYIIFDDEDNPIYK